MPRPASAEVKPEILSHKRRLREQPAQEFAVRADALRWRVHRLRTFVQRPHRHKIRSSLHNVDSASVQLDPGSRMRRDGSPFSTLALLVDFLAMPDSEHQNE